MSDALQQLISSTFATNATLQSDTPTPPPAPLMSTELQSFNLPENYSVLINKLERLALGLDAAFNNLSLDHKEVEIAVTGGSNSGATHAVHVIPDEFLLNAGPITSGRGPPPYVPQHPRHGAYSNVAAEGMEYSRVVSDIWIGVILTLLIVSVIFFICSCFLYHKFQQWKNSYRTNPNEPVEICRRYPADFEAESLPSYTIVSGLPTYDDALEEFRKAGIILTPPIPMIKLFDSSANATNDTKDNIYDNNTNNNNMAGDGDNISISSTCTCGGNNGGNNNATLNSTINNSNTSLNASALLAAAAAAAASTQPGQQVIELNPDQLEQLSKKRLSLQIAFNSPVPSRRSSRPRIDLYREVNRNNLLRSRAYGGGAPTSPDAFPPIHRSSSSLSLSNNHLFDRRLSHLQHRGSLF